MISERIEILRQSLERMEHLRPIVQEQFLANFQRVQNEIEAELDQITIDFLTDKFGLNLEIK